MTTHDQAPSVSILPSAARVALKYRVDDGVPDSNPTRTHSLAASGSSRGALYGSGTSLDPSPSSRPPSFQVHASGRDCERLGPEARPRPLPPVPVHPSTEHPPNRSEFAGAAAAFAMAPPELVTENVHGERLLHLALPWRLGQRVLAMMAGEDVHSQVDSEGSEPLPAYEPRRY